jgi:hypothetical protein
MGRILLEKKDELIDRSNNLSGVYY